LQQLPPLEAELDALENAQVNEADDGEKMLNDEVTAGKINRRTSFQ